MISIITGDIINSRKTTNPDKWLSALKKTLSGFGKSPKNWEIYRGDSFQVEIKKAEEAFFAAVSIKACIKAVKDLDVRMAIGIGQKTYDAPKITESNGDAFIYSGELFENLKKLKQNLAIKTDWPEADAELNLMFALASIPMDKWSVSSAEFVQLSLQNSQLLQKELANKLGRTQSSVSERQTRAHYNEVMDVDHYFRNKIKKLTDK